MADYVLQQDVRINLRDGIALSANIWLPKGQGAWPAILLRTPYSNDPSEYERLNLQAYVDEGYAVIYQLVRGVAPSEGAFGFFHCEGKDGYDSIEWIAAQDWCNGKVAMDGGSYLGTVQWLAAREQPPHLTCIMPSVPAGDYFNEIPYKGGAFGIDWAASWLSAQAGQPFEFEDDNATSFEPYRPLNRLGEKLGVDMPLLDKVLAHPTFDDYWQQIQFTDEDFSKITIPVFTITGWFDGDQAGSLYYWRGIEQNFADKARTQLVIGPWMHGECYLGGVIDLEQMQFGDDSILPIQKLRIDFLNKYMTADGAQSSPPRVNAFIMGMNEWRSDVCYPPQGSSETDFYLSSAAALQLTPGHDGIDQYLYDPANPVPYFPGAADHQGLLARDDVLVFASAPLDTAVTALGPVAVSLFVTTDGTDTDFVAKLYDIDPHGRAVNLSHIPGVIRARYRNGYERAEPVTPGEVFAVQIKLPDIGHCFLPGHRIGLDVTSSCFPLVDPNTNTGGDFRTDTETRIAQQSVLYGAGHPSRLTLTTIDNAQS